MRIEVMVDNEDPKIFPLGRGKLIIGSGDQCDITVANPGVSRKHIAIVSEGDQYFVIDQGSTNGSYINEERLVPGRKVELTSFFPVRLGGTVLLTLLSDADANSFAFDSAVNQKPAKEASSPKIKLPLAAEPTRTSVLQNLEEYKTETLVKKRVQRVEKSRLKDPETSSEGDNSRMTLVKLGCVVLFGFAVYYNLFKLEPTQSKLVATPAKVVTVAPEVKKPVILKVDQADLTPKEKFQEIQSGMNCSTDIEKYFCDVFPEHEAQVVQVGTMVHIFHDGTLALEEAKKMMPEPKGHIKPALPSDLRYVAMILFLTNYLKKEIDLTIFSGLKITVVLKMPDDENNQSYVAAAFVPESYNKFLATAQPNIILQVQKFGAAGVDFLKTYMSYY